MVIYKKYLNGIILKTIRHDTGAHCVAHTAIRSFPAILFKYRKS